MPFIPDGLWKFTNNGFTLCVRLISMVEEPKKKGLFSRRHEANERIVGHQMCLACIKTIIAKLEPPKEPTPEPPCPQQ